MQIVTRASAISDRALFAFTVAWVVVGGLMLQLVMLPYVLQQAHWGHGLIYSMDSMSFHLLAAEQAERIRDVGWSAWQLRPGGQFPAGLASIFYVLVHPEPWVVLPANGLFFGLTVVTVRRTLAVLFGSPTVALAAVAPFFLFFSFVPIWGQLHKDVVGGAGFALVLSALVFASSANSARTRSIVLVAAAGMALLWLVRPYAVFLVAAATGAYVVVRVFGRSGRRLQLATAAAVVVVAAALTASPWGSTTVTMDVPSSPPQAAVPMSAPTASSPAPAGADESTPPSGSGWFGFFTSLRWPRSERIDPAVRGIYGQGRYYASCAPAPTSHLVDRLLFVLCFRREGFKVDGERAGSNVDYDVRMRFISDYVAYVPRALQMSLLEPLPTRWGAERSFVGRLGSVLVPWEMLLAYVSFALAIAFGYRRLAHTDVWAVVAYCCTYTAVFAYTVPNIGTVYRMRAFAFTIVVSTALAAFLAGRQALLPAAPEVMD